MILNKKSGVFFYSLHFYGFSSLIAFLLLLLVSSGANASSVYFAGINGTGNALNGYTVTGFNSPFILSNNSLEIETYNNTGGFGLFVEGFLISFETLLINPSSTSNQGLSTSSSGNFIITYEEEFSPFLSGIFSEFRLTGEDENSIFSLNLIADSEYSENFFSSDISAIPLPAAPFLFLPEYSYFLYLKQEKNHSNNSLA